MWTIDIETLLEVPGKVWTYWKNTQNEFMGCNNFMAESLNLVSKKDITGKTNFSIGVEKKESEIYQSQDNFIISNKIPAQFYDSATLPWNIFNFIVFKFPLFKNEKVIGVLGMSYVLDEIINNNHTYFLDRFRNSISCKQLESLSPREKDCLKLTVMGKTAKQIAKILNLSHRTVEYYLQHIKLKLGIQFKSQLIEKVFYEFSR